MPGVKDPERNAMCMELHLGKAVMIYRYKQYCIPLPGLQASWLTATLSLKAATQSILLQITAGVVKKPFRNLPLHNGDSADPASMIRPRNPCDL